jgi:SAM-dependent methyltransferase
MIDSAVERRRPAWHLQWSEDINITPWLIPGGALDVERCPACWELRAHYERYLFASQALSGMRVLDFGCGVGYGAWLLAEAGNQVVGYDQSMPAIKRAQASGIRENPAFTHERCEWDPFDACVAFEVIEHLEFPEAFIHTVQARHLIASVPVEPTLGHNPNHRHDFTVESFRELIERRFRIKWWWTQTRPFRHEPAYAIFHGELFTEREQ